jgi:hypothetical protein
MIHKNAVIYKKHLISKTFLLLFEGHSIEIMFKAENLLHLCGVDTKLLAKDFYQKAYQKKLSDKEIYFSKKHPYDFAKIKLEHLPQAISLLNNESFVITDISTQTKMFKLGATDLEVIFCFDSQIDNNGNIINNILIPYSLRVEGIPNSKFGNMYEVNYVLSKKTGTKTYINIEYGNPNLLTSYLEKHSISGYSINITNQ